MSSPSSHRALASRVSRDLRTGGLNPLGSGTPRTREGIRVSADFVGVTISADFDSPSQAAEATESVRQILSGRGYRIAVDTGRTLVSVEV